MKNLLVLGLLLLGSLLFDFLLDIPLGIPLHQDIQVIIKRILVLDPILLALASISLVIIIILIGTKSETPHKGSK